VPPQRAGGVYDFARKLSNAIGGNSTCLVHLSNENATDWRVEPGDTVILQMSGYGFDNRGVPLWLIQEVEERRKHFGTFGVYFHELYAFGPPWTSSFWLSPTQRLIARRICEMSDFWMTNRVGSALWLKRFAVDKPHAVLPVFSNVGEMTSPPQTRLPKVIVFGSAGLRQVTYRAAGKKFFDWAKSALLEIHDIGAPLADRQLAATLSERGVVQHGRLGEEEISEILKDSMFGLLAYPVDYVAKSGVFAAYAAHGLCPILVSESNAEADGLISGRHYFSNVPKQTDFHRHADVVGRSVWEWYQPHQLEQHAEAIRGLVRCQEGL
jgi:hypothetical protein